MKLGIVGAMPEEVDRIFEVITDKHLTEQGDRVYYEGRIDGVEVVCTFSRWGKVAAATTITNLIVGFQVDCILFVGIAGSLTADLHVGDIVVAQRLYQHDMDARPLMRRFEIPLTGKTSLELAEAEVNRATRAVHNFLKKHNAYTSTEAGERSQRVKSKMMVGDIATGDLFVSNMSMRKALNRNLPSALCADMESAAVAQVCADYRVPLSVVRAISDNADETANDDAISFVTMYGGHFLMNITEEYIAVLKENELDV